VTTACARRFGTVAVAGFAGVASMIGGVETAGAQTQPSACELLTKRDAKKILGKAVRRETNLSGTEATSCSYVVAGDAKRVVGLGVGTFASVDEAANAYARARADAQFDGLKIENVRELGDRAYYVPKTNNFERTVREKKLAFGELTVLDGQDLYTAFVTPPSKNKARDAIKAAIDRNRRRPE
jgi:hypothetical protein